MPKETIMRLEIFVGCCTVVALSWPVASAQQQTATTMPPAATGILAQMDKEILVSKKKAVESLEKVLRDTTKKGDLAGAMTVKQTVDRLNAEIAALSTNKGGRGAADILGRWQGQGHDWIVEYFPDGTVTSTDNGVTGKWVLNGAAVETKFSNGVTHTMERVAEGWAGLSTYNGKTTPLRYARVP